jgi:hypothetical protein
VQQVEALVVGGALAAEEIGDRHGPAHAPIVPGCPSTAVS